jgi:hypothetical protein
MGPGKMGKPGRDVKALQVRLAVLEVVMASLYVAG